MAGRRRARVVWAAPAADELDEIGAWIAIEDPPTARRVVRRIFTEVARLRENPHLGRYVPEVGTKTYRELVVRPFRVIYRTDGKDVLIVCVLRGARELQPWNLR